MAATAFLGANGIAPVAATALAIVLAVIVSRSARTGFAGTAAANF
jgi:hypothetical protein